MKKILKALEGLPSDIATVAIGGINGTNALDLIAKSATDKKRLDGFAVVSAIMAAPDPQAAAYRLLEPSNPEKNGPLAAKVLSLVASAPEIIAAVLEKRPLSHNMTNTVRILNNILKWLYLRAR